MLISFVACCKLKSSKKTTAEKMYISPLFKLSLEYAKKNSDKVFILSAKYGLLALDDIIDPYNETLNTKTENEIKEWSNNILKQIRKLELEDSDFLYLCGSNYKKYIEKKLKGSDPMNGLSLGYRLQWLKKHTTKPYNILDD
jgi:cytoplasmic iron level regulating protein YaaA (DUF328/UPF0246 family)